MRVIGSLNAAIEAARRWERASVARLRWPVLSMSAAMSAVSMGLFSDSVVADNEEWSLFSVTCFWLQRSTSSVTSAKSSPSSEGPSKERTRASLSLYAPPPLLKADVASLSIWLRHVPGSSEQSSGSRKPMRKPRCSPRLFGMDQTRRLRPRHPVFEVAKARRRSTMKSWTGNGSSSTHPLLMSRGRSRVTGNNFTGGVASCSTFSSIDVSRRWSSKPRYSVRRSPRIFRPMTMSRCWLLLNNVFPSAATQKVIASQTIDNNASNASFSVAAPSCASYKSLSQRCCCKAPYRKMNGQNNSASASVWMSRKGVSAMSMVPHTVHTMTMFITFTMMHMRDCAVGSPVNCRNIKDQAKSPNIKLAKSSCPTKPQRSNAEHIMCANMTNALNLCPGKCFKVSTAARAQAQLEAANRVATTGNIGKSNTK
mmetsp:Transcript_41479/g.117471  ORF Transcript_41479/g.117471 Transcript_41479/m.117471 type:complete len:425 (-) Transcript_41479:233-1507(-)